MFSRLMNLFRGFLSLFISGIEKKNPEALLEAEKEHFRKMVAQYNTALAPQAGVIERLKRQISTGEKSERELKAKVTANLNAGNKDVAAQLALEYSRVKTERGRDEVPAHFSFDSHGYAGAYPCCDDPSQ